MQALILALCSIGQLFLATSCFTGIEGTKKISLSRDDRKTLRPSAEEEFFRPVAGEPLSEWTPGREFIAADNKALLIFNQEGLPLDPDAVALKGKTLVFEGTDRRIMPDGSYDMTLIFRCGDDRYVYDTGKNLEAAPLEVTSDKIPMLIDLKMIESARTLLRGKKLWTKSPLWYDDAGSRINGLKFIPVTIVDVEPGTIAFPLKVKFTTSDARSAWAMMNFGYSGKESRSFANLFYLSDLRERYPQIEDDVWHLICRGKVRAGMTKEECKLSLGNPSEVDSGHDYTQTLDLWHYPDGAVLWFEDGFLTRFRQ